MESNRVIAVIAHTISIVAGLTVIALALLEIPTSIILIFLFVALIFVNVSLALKSNKLFRQVSQKYKTPYRILTVGVLPVISILVIIYAIVSLSTNQLQLVSIRVVPELSLWDNLSNKDDTRVLGFRENSIYLWNKWRWLPEPETNYNYEITYRDTSLRIVYALIRLYFENSSSLDKSCIPYSELFSSERYTDFRFQLINNYRSGGDFFQCLRTVWPINIVPISDERIYNRVLTAIKEFELDFFRDHRPIFEIIIQNNSEQEWVIVSTSIDMKNIIVDTTPTAYGGNTLSISGFYDISIDNLEDEQYKEWLKQKSEQNPFGFIEHYPNLLRSTSYELAEPRIVVPAKGNCRFIFRVVKGYVWQCMIRFRFNYGQKKELRSSWYIFEPTTHPTKRQFVR